MRFSRSTILKTSLKGRNPLQQFYNLLNTDTEISPQEFINNTRIEALDQRANAYKVTYSVGGFSQGNEPEPLNEEEIIGWVRSAYPDDFTQVLALSGDEYRLTRPDGSVMNLPSSLERMRYRWLESLLSDDDFITQLGLYAFESSEWVSFLDALSGLSPTDLLVTARDVLLEQEGQIESLGSLVQQMRDFLTSAEEDNELIKQQKLLLAQIAYGVLPDETKINFTLAEQPGFKRYRWNNANFAVPYVLRNDTSNYYDTIGSDGSSFHLNPEYHYYLDCYEERISGSAIHENLLPNLYVHGLTLNGVPAPFPHTPPSRISSDWEGPGGDGVYLQYAYDTHTTLKHRTLLPDVQMSQDSMSQYLQQVGNILASGEIPEEEQLQLADIVDSIIFPESEYGMFNSIGYNDFAFPMKIDVQIPFSQTGEAGDILRQNNVDNVVSRAIEYYEQDGVRDLATAQNYDFHSEFLLHVDFENRQTFSRPQEYHNPSISLPTYNFNALMFGLTFDERINLAAYGGYAPGDLPGGSLIFSALGNEPAGSLLSPQQQQSVAQSWLQMQTFGDNLLNVVTPVFNEGKPTYSEALLYKLEKRNSDGELIQSLYFENKKDIEAIVYTDTQIKYNKVYDYQIIEYRLMVGIEETFTLCNTRIPSWVDLLPLQGETIEVNFPGLGGNVELENQSDFLSDQIRTQMLQSQAENPAPFVYEFIVTRSSYVSIVEHRIVGPEIFEGVSAGGFSFPPVKVLDRPPVAPDLMILPIKDNYRQVKALLDPGSGQYLREEALPIVSIGNNEDKIKELSDYQTEFEYYKLPTDKLEYADESVAELKQFTIYCTTTINENVSNYNDVYRSFDPGTNEDVRVKQFRTDELIDLEGDYAPGFAAMLDLEPNVTYYITCTVEDVHQNVSNPSPIYEARLHYEKGLLVPEVKIYHFVPINNRQISRKMARFIEIKASAIQTQPAIITNDLGEVVGTRRALAADIGDRVTNNDFVIRFTSRDTGKKFDLRVSFNQKDILPEEDRIRCAPLITQQEPVNVNQGVMREIQRTLQAARNLGAVIPGSNIGQG